MAAVDLAPAEIQVLQVLTIVVFAPFVSGGIAHLEARLQGRRGPRILQPYYDLAKLFRKETLVPEDASWVFVLGPMLAFTCYLVVPLLIPVLTTYPLPLGYMGDISGRRVHPGAGRLLRGRGGGRDRWPLRPAGQQPGHDVRGAHRAVHPVHHLHRGAGNHHRPALLRGGGRPGLAQPGGPPRPPPRRPGLLLGGVERHRTHPGRDPRQHSRVRDDRRGPHPRALGAAVRPFEVGIGDEAADPLRDPGQRLRRTLGARGVACTWGSPARHPHLVGKGASAWGRSSP